MCMNCKGISRRGFLEVLSAGAVAALVYYYPRAVHDPVLSALAALLLKPAPRTLASLLWALQHGGLDNVKGLDEVPHLAASGRTSFAADASIHKGFYRAAGFHLSRAIVPPQDIRDGRVRIRMIEGSIVETELKVLTYDFADGSPESNLLDALQK